MENKLYFVGYCKRKAYGKLDPYNNMFILLETYFKVLHLYNSQINLEEQKENKITGNFEDRLDDM